MPGQPPSLKELFLAALAVPPDDRADWLRQACGQDAKLRQHVELMLTAHEEPQSLLDLPILGQLHKEMSDQIPWEPKENPPKQEERREAAPEGSPT